jgi:alpha-tubulin suppressor-like RCC1 family protein
LSTKVDVPQPVQLHTKAIQVTGGTVHMALLDAKGQIWTWGDGATGQLGHGDIRPRLTPTMVSAANEFVFVACGPYFNVALARSGTVFSWCVHLLACAQHSCPIR